MRVSRRSRTPDEVVLRRTARVIEGVEPASSRRVIRAYVSWLEEERGLSAAYVERLVRIAIRLLARWVGSGNACVGAIRRLSPDEVEGSLTRWRRDLAARPRNDLTWGTIRFLQFCTARSWLSDEFFEGVPSLSPRRTPLTPCDPGQRTTRAISKKKVPSASARRVLHAYVRWLTDVRKLAPSTIDMRLRTARLLVASWLGQETACVDRLRRLRVNDVEDYFLQHRAGGAGQSAQRHMQAGLRLFLRFCVAQKWASQEIVAAVPRMRSYRLSTLPRGVAQADIPAFATMLRSSSISKRDRAIVLLLITYGVRRGQIVALQLRDLDWRKRRITFAAHKGGRTVQHMLTPAVAQALAEYLGERPADCGVNQVFLRARAPYVGISPSGVTHAVARLFERAGVDSRPCGPHAFRHAFAKRVLSAGKPFKTVADLLGHRSLNSTAIYAKVDVQRLIEAPLEWPEVLR